MFSKLNGNDEFTLITFNNELTTRINFINPVKLESTKLNSVLDSIDAGYRTDLVNALEYTLNKFKSSSFQNKILLILSDFAENYETEPYQKILDKFKNSENEILILNFAEGGNKTDINSCVLLDRLSNATNNIKIYNSSESEAFLKQFLAVSGNPLDSDCCDVVFKINPCFFGKDTTLSSYLTVTYKGVNYSFEQQVILKCKSNFVSSGNDAWITYSYNNSDLEIICYSHEESQAILNMSNVLGTTNISLNKFLARGINIIRINLLELFPDDNIMIINTMINNTTNTAKFILR